MTVKEIEKLLPAMPKFYQNICATLLTELHIKNTTIDMLEDTISFLEVDWDDSINR
jgi:hypothetical protein